MWLGSFGREIEPVMKAVKEIGTRQRRIKMRGSTVFIEEIKY